MIRQLGSSLTDVTYVFDEPTIGLHPHDIQRMNDLLLRLRDKGNTVLVVEHKPETIEIANHVAQPRKLPHPAAGFACSGKSRPRPSLEADTLLSNPLQLRSTALVAGKYSRADWNFKF